MRKIIAWTVLILIGIIIMFGVPTTRPTNLGVHNGLLSPCPESPNCVCSQGNQDSEHSIAPLRFEKSAANAWSALKQVVASQKRATVITVTDTYLHAEFRSLIFKFVDDVEFVLDEPARVIQVRSASRVGRSDLGVNRKRVEAFRREFEALQP